MTSRALVVRALDAERDVEWAEQLLDASFAGRMQARRGQLIDVLALPGFIAERAVERVGLLTYDSQDECELAVLIATERGVGIGTALVDALRNRAGDRPIWVVTTNDNLDALAFYQRQGFRLRALRAGAVDSARRTLKPSIGFVAENGIPIRDELELVLDPAAARGTRRGTTGGSAADRG